MKKRFAFFQVAPIGRHRVGCPACVPEPFLPCGLQFGQSQLCPLPEVFGPPLAGCRLQQGKIIGNLAPQQPVGIFVPFFLRFLLAKLRDFFLSLLPVVFGPPPVRGRKQVGEIVADSVPKQAVGIFSQLVQLAGGPFAKLIGPPLILRRFQPGQIATHLSPKGQVGLFVFLQLCSDDGGQPFVRLLPVAE